MSSFVTAGDTQRAGEGSVLLPHVSRIPVCTGQGAGNLTFPSVTELAMMFPNQRDIWLYAD